MAADVQVARCWLSMLHGVPAAHDVAAHGSLSPHLVSSWAWEQQPLLPSGVFDAKTGHKQEHGAFLRLPITPEPSWGGREAARLHVSKATTLLQALRSEHVQMSSSLQGSAHEAKRAACTLQVATLSQVSRIQGFMPTMLRHTLARKAKSLPDKRSRATMAKAYFSLGRHKTLPELQSRATMS